MIVRRPSTLAAASLVVLAAASVASPAGAARSARWLDLGTRGHSAEVVSATGLDGPRARIVARHTRATALDYCRGLAVYEGRRPSDQYLRPCIRRALAEPPQEHVARADCLRGLVTVAWGPMHPSSNETWGPTFRYGGYDGAADKWIDQHTGKVLFVGPASNHDAVTNHFELLCPKTASALRPSLNERTKAYLRRTRRSP